MQQIPLTQIAFVFLATLLAFYTFHLYRLYRADKNPLALAHAYVGLFSVGALYSLSLPFLITPIKPLLLWSDYLSVACLTGLFVSFAYILWFSGLQSVVRFRFVALSVIIIGILTLASDVLWLDVDTTVSPAVYLNPTSSLWLKSLLFVMVMAPGSILYFRQALRASSVRQAIRVSAMGLLFLTMAITIVTENILSRGKGTILEGVARLVIGGATAITMFVTRDKTPPTISV